MIIHNHPISWYVEQLTRRKYFSLGMYGDAEWICIFRDSIGQRNAENTVYTLELCDALIESLNYKSDNFYFSTPKILDHLRYAARIDTITRIEFVEKDIWDTQCRLGGLVEFIKQLQSMKLCIISNKHLRGLTFLDYAEYIEISYPNCFDEIDRVMKSVEELGSEYIYIISAGLPAAIIAQKIHTKFEQEVFALDLGSIWDAFVRIGAQRGWRKELYDDPRQYDAWRNQYKKVLGDDHS